MLSILRNVSLVKEKGVLISSGQILKVLGPYEDLNRQHTLMSSNGHVHPDLMMYLKCSTQKAETVYLPYGSKGRFYCIASAKFHTINHLFLLSNLLRATRLPLLIRIISGDKPQMAFPYTNIIQLNEVHCETILLGCTLIENEPILLEMNANSAFSFLKALDDKLLYRSETYRRMCQLCTIQGDQWRQQIRIAHHVIPQKCNFFDKRQGTPSDKMSARSEGINRVTGNRCKKMKRIFPGSELLDFLKYTYRSHIFPKKFWMFRKARKFEITDKWDENIGPGFDILKTYYTKYKGKKCLTLKIRATKDLLMLKGAEKSDPKSKKNRTSSDDGYVTSCIDDESIYHSIC